MGAGQSMPPIKHRLQQAFRLPLARIKRIIDLEPQLPEKLEITVTQTITQETTPISRSDNTPRRSPVRSPSLLTINADAALSPSGSPAGVALGIPAEHILDENASEIDAPMPRLTLSNLARMTEAEAFTVSNTPSSLTAQGSGRSHGMQSPFEVSSMTPVCISPEHIVEISRHRSNPSACYFCGIEYWHNLEPKVYLPCGHSFGIRCLYKWMSAGRIDTGQIRCPHQCISLRHHCGHLTTSCSSEPYPWFTDVSATAIPSVYEFCKKGRGRMLNRDVKRLQKIEVALMQASIENRRGRLHKFLDVICFRQPPFSKKLLLAVRRLRGQVLSELQRKHLLWWINEWLADGYVPLEEVLTGPQDDIMDNVIRNYFLQIF
ncbi:hypothetical protein LI328DRAFT_167358 [Trichoderma asperelloides]|nr:hypothetical protein LI328DRAFT_167358 [Trichoderma asperelloides]